MRIIERDITENLRKYAEQFPVVFLTGPRQSGKSTLLLECFPQYDYVNLEDISLREQAVNDPKGFLRLHKHPLIVDEAQYVPELFSYIQILVDKHDTPGMFILSGSQNFLLMESISQSLAGRVGVLNLLPFSQNELNKIDLRQTLEERIFNGGYPRVYKQKIDPTMYYNSYIQTYVERDVRLLKNIGNVSQFIDFMRVCANRVGSLLDITDIANVCGISQNTVKSWLSLLETSFICFKLTPYYNNFDKRIRKSPKIYFYDTGLLCSLLSIKTSDNLAFNNMFGHVFENFAIVERMKKCQNRGNRPELYFWRQNEIKEIDLIEIGSNGELIATEIKSSKTARESMSAQLLYFKKLANIPDSNLRVIYGGDEFAQFNNVKYVPWMRSACPPLSHSLPHSPARSRTGPPMRG